MTGDMTVEEVMGYLPYPSNTDELYYESNYVVNSGVSPDRNSTIYDGSTWQPDASFPLENIDPALGYRLKLQAAQTLAFTGNPVPLDTPIVIKPGVNWIPYLRHTAMPLSGTTDSALPNFDYQNGDMIKSQTSFSTYYAGYGWFGSLTMLVPCQSYSPHHERERHRALRDAVPPRPLPLLSRRSRSS